jgi:hypothetical protein
VSRTPWARSSEVTWLAIASAACPTTSTTSVSPEAARLRSAMSRMVVAPATGSSVLGSVSVSGRNRRPAPAASTIPINEPSPSQTVLVNLLSVAA